MRCPLKQSSDDNGLARQPGADRYHTLARSGAAEIRIQRSRFVAHATPAGSPEQARRLIAQTAGRYHDCRHVCYAWRIGHGEDLQEMRSDGGEPTGTAGKPILAAIRKADLTDSVVVVARYFGGIKLGTGGLARAYGEAATEALAAAPRRTVIIGRTGQLSFAYSWQKTIAGLLQRYGGEVVDEEYADAVVWRIWLPQSAWSDFARQLTEATAGEVQIKAPAESDRS